MSEKIVLETLKGIGLTEKDAEVYIKIAKCGTIIAREITNAFKINKAQVYRSLKNLQSKGIVEASIETPQTFTAIPFEKVYDIYQKIKNDEAKKIEQNRETAIQQWQTLAIQQTIQSSDRFMVLEGKNFIYTKIQEMINKSETQVLIATESNNLIQADLDDAIDEILQNKKVNIKVVSEITTSNAEYIAELLEQFNHNIKARHVDLEEKVFPSFVLSDDKELIFLTAGLEPRLDNKIEAGLWTNNKSLIQTFQVLFNQLWQTGIDFQEKIQQVMHGKQPIKITLIRDSQEAENTLITCFAQAKKEIIMITTEQDLPLIETRKHTFAETCNRGVSIQILVPISEKNRNAANELKKIGVQIKHIPNSYFRAITIDTTHLFQLKTTPPSTIDQIPPDYFGSTFYTNDPEYVTGRRNLLQNMWNQAPSEIEKLQQTLAKFRSIYENNEDAIMLTNSNGEIITANTAACNLFGMTLEEIKKTNRQNILIHNQEVDQANKQREKTGKSKAELTFKRKDGTTFQGEATVSNFTDTDGQIKDCIIIRDTTQRQQAENTLKESQQRFQAMFNYIGLGIAMVSIDGKITQTNPAFQKIMGYTQQELETKSSLELTHPEDRHLLKNLYQNLRECKTKNATIEKRNIRKDDTVIKVRLNISVFTSDKAGQPLEYILTIEDITSQTQDADIKHLQENLKTSEERFQTLLNNSIDYVYRHNLQTGHYEFSSPSLEKIVGYNTQEFLNLSNEEVLATVHPEDLPKLQTDLANIIKQGKGSAEYRLRRKDGTYIWYRNNMFMTYDTYGRPLYRDGIGQDITELKESQATIEALKKQIANQTTTPKPTNKRA